jgi:hypothetical protein
LAAAATSTGYRRNNPRRVIDDGLTYPRAGLLAGGGFWLRRGAAGLADQRLGTLTSQLLEPRADRRKIIGSSGSSMFATQLVEASTDYCKIVGRTGSGHISSPLSVVSGS